MVPMNAVPAAALLLAAMLAACAAPAESAEPSDGASSQAPPASESGSPDASASQPAAGDLPTVVLEEVAGGLDSPINITVAPDGWLLVNERGGRVVAVDPASGATELTLDISDRVLGQDEQGLLGLALHPGWPDDPRAFVHYSAREGDGDTVLSEFRVTDEPLPPRLDPSTERVLLTLDQPYPNHNGGQLAFGPDGFLYLGLGDGGSGGDPQGNGQNPDVLLGKILRIDVDAEERSYAIPADNPFTDGGGAPEAFLIGLRNPWRFSFDRETGLMWIGDVGQETAEEVDRIDPAADAGANLGWNVMEASLCFAEPDCSTDGLTLPVVEYRHDLGCSVTGGYVYRGDAIGGLDGWYLFSDICSGTIFGVPAEAEGLVAPRVLLDTELAVSSFGEGPDGELYVADLQGGTVYRIVAGD
jgi:glucose/arabinose dehydrogenase